jgi:hypothetical protein
MYSRRCFVDLRQASCATQLAIHTFNGKFETHKFSRGKWHAGNKVAICHTKLQCRQTVVTRHDVNLNKRKELVSRGYPPDPSPAPGSPPSQCPQLAGHFSAVLGWKSDDQRLLKSTDGRKRPVNN